MEREQAQAEAAGVARARSGVGGKSAQSGLVRGGPLPMQAELLFSLQQSVGNRAVTRLVQRWRDQARDVVSPAGLAHGYGRRDQVVQRSFDHKGKSKKATTYGPKASLPKIHGVSETDLRLLADDTHNYLAIENKQQFDLAWAVYQQRHPKQAEEGPLEQEFTGNVTVLDDTVEQNEFAGTVRMTLQVDWLQGKHDGLFMKKHSTVAPREQGGNQMRQTLPEYQDFARGAPLQLAKDWLHDIFLQPQRKALDFSVMADQQSDGLFYEISAKWANTGPGARQVLVYYHCYPHEDDQERFGFRPKKKK